MNQFYIRLCVELYEEVLGGGGDKFSIMPVVFPRRAVIISSLGYFSSVDSSSKASYPPFPLSLVEHLIQYYFNKKRGVKGKN